MQYLYKIPYPMPDTQQNALKDILIIFALIIDWNTSNLFTYFYP